MLDEPDDHLDLRSSPPIRIGGTRASLDAEACRGRGTLVLVVTVRRANTILYTDRWADTVAFYRDTLCWPVGADNGWFVEFAVGPGAFVSVADARRSTIAAGHGAGITLSLQVEDVQAVRTELLRAGVEVEETKMRWGASVLDVHDPSGNRLEFWAPSATGLR
jgi:catechol 2,3-dioxygenase-like lactoylglutathione lyase family enzyme